MVQRLSALQSEVHELHTALLAERRSVVALREELGLMATSRDTWRVRAAWEAGNFGWATQHICVYWGCHVCVCVLVSGCLGMSGLLCNVE